MLGNHDQSRIASRTGPAKARLAAMLLLTLRGTPTIYQGDEPGMTDVDIPPDRVRDPWELNMTGLGEGRDPVRTPMRWDGTTHAGFYPDDVEPWLPMGADVDTVNVAAGREDAGSTYALHRGLLRLRRERDSLSLGDHARIDAADEVLPFERRAGAERTLVALNFGDAPSTVSLQEGDTGSVLVSARPGRRGERLAATFELAAHDGLVISLAAEGTCGRPGRNVPRADGSRPAGRTRGGAPAP